MQKFITVFFLTVLCFAAQFLCARLLGPFFVPNFILIAVIFFNLYRGLNLSLAAAFWGGFLLDSFSGSSLGSNTFSLVICAFLAGTLKMYIYQPGAVGSRVLIVFLSTVAFNLLHFLIQAVAGVEVHFHEAFWWVILPEIILTTAVASTALERLKQCALRLSV